MDYQARLVGPGKWAYRVKVGGQELEGLTDRAGIRVLLATLVNLELLEERETQVILAIRALQETLASRVTAEKTD